MKNTFTGLLWSWILLLGFSVGAAAQDQPPTPAPAPAAPATPAAPAPAAAPATKIPLDGQWKGELPVPGGSLPVVITVTDLAGGGYFAVLDVPAQRISHAVLNVEQRADTLLFSSDELGCRFTSQRSADGKQLAGLWKLQTYQTPLTLAFSAKAGPSKNFKFPPPYRVEEVSFSNPQDNIKLSGTLSIPPGEGPFPGVVLLSDMGPQDRDATQGEFKMFGALSDFLARHGIAVLRLDDRGIGQSSGDFTAATTADLVRDAQISLNYLRTKPLIDFGKLGLIGHGEGGNVALLAAAQPLPPAFVVTLAASGAAGKDVLSQQAAGFLKAGEADTAQAALVKKQLMDQWLLDQKIKQLRAKGANTAQIQTLEIQHNMRKRDELKKLQETIAKQQRAILDVIQQTTDNAQAQPIVANMVAQSNPGLDAAQVQARTNLITSRWYRSYLNFDPQLELGKVKSPVLLMHGTDDNQVSVNNVSLLEKGLKSKGNKQVEARRLAGINHQFQPPATEWPLMGGEPKPVLSPQVQQTILEWINLRVAK
ncbi:serine aminopeptidase domain-containing protein [Hymenobacter cellulosivorans]|uniref:Alpha/beta hydrolase n=1 Tax=Hymenobacter cellulosivorans TaxID=2932249 RepID=A0ABY4F4T5_9BACT|nr:alpha/beta hydrolase [Hymenobacter cellulosivorans]UOQ51062.1 alpha/beta hydrolase [Hymenobacter cellulosivorans]